MWCSCARVSGLLSDHTHLSDRRKKVLSMSAAINTLHPQSHDGKGHRVFRRENGREEAVSSQIHPAHFRLSPHLQATSRKEGVRMQFSSPQTGWTLLVIKFLSSSVHMEISWDKMFIITLASCFPKPIFQERNKQAGDYLVGIWIIWEGR